jgi:hypothetical protein
MARTRRGPPTRQLAQRPPKRRCRDASRQNPLKPYAEPAHLTAPGRACRLQEDPNKGKKNEWSVDSNVPKSDPSFASLLDVVDEQSDVARWMRNNQGARAQR